MLASSSVPDPRLAHDCAVILAACAAGLLLILGAHFRQWIRWWSEYERPYTVALFRIVFATALLANLLGLAEHWEFLFTEEGLFTGADAHRAYAGRSFRAYAGGDGSEPSTTRLLGLLRSHKFSLLWIWDSREAVVAHLIALFTALFAVLLGWRTRATVPTALFLYLSLTYRNEVYIEGTDTVFRVFFVLLLFARSGDAWSLDARRRGERDVPAWPRRLMMVQMAILLSTTGLAKYGGVWARGDAIYYAWNLDHFYRVPPQAWTAVLGTHVLRVATWATHWGEALFALVLAGVWVRWQRASALPERHVVARWVASIGAWMLVIGVAALVWRVAGPRRCDLRDVVVPALVILAWATLGLLQRLPPRWVERAIPWAFGRRVWVTFAASLMAGIFVLMNIGLFQPVMLTGLIPFLEPHETHKGVRRWLPRFVKAPALRPVRPPLPRLPAALLTAVLTFHIGAIGVWLSPDFPCVRDVRRPVRRAVTPWVLWSQSAQWWRMFAPNPPRSNTMLRTLIYDRDGRAWDMNSDVYAPAMRPIPYLWNNRMRRINRTILKGPKGKASWYAKWFGRWQCRQWNRAHPDHPPERVELVRWTYRIPSPEQTHARGWYEPTTRMLRDGRQKVVFTEKCAT